MGKKLSFKELNSQYEEAKLYQKYRNKKNYFNTIKSLVPAFFSLAIASVALSAMARSLESSGLLEDALHSGTGKLNPVTVNGGN